MEVHHLFWQTLTPTSLALRHLMVYRAMHLSSKLLYLYLISRIKSACLFLSILSLVFITGLAGHAYGSWKASGKTTMWIQDFLVPDLQPYSIRILTYSYDSRLPGSTSNAGISEFAQGFLHLFCNARQSKNVRPPIA